MIDRFTDPNGAAALKQIVMEQRVVAHNQDVAEKLIAAGTVLQHKAGEDLISQGAADEQVFFMLTGEVAIEVNTRVVGRRTKGDMVGEIAAVDPTVSRTATVRAIGDVVSLRVEGKQFLAVADEHPQVWRMTTRIIGERLEERNQFHRLPNPKPVLFLGTSVESLAIAQQIQLGLEHDPIECRVWTDGIFGPSSIAIETLVKQTAECDFAAFVFGPDDKVNSRGNEQDAPRDNVIFEMGMFINELGRERTFVIKERTADLKIPSDLTGVAPISWKQEADADPKLQFATVCTELRNQIGKLGPV